MRDDLHNAIEKAKANNIDLKIANLATDGPIIEEARKTAIDLLEKDATLKNPEHKNLHYFLQHQKNHGGIWGKIS